MADQPPLDPPSPPDSASSHTHAGKRPATTAIPPPPPKRHQKPTHAAINTSSNSDETFDTASTLPEEPIEQVELPDDIVLQELNEHEFMFGANPVDDDDHMQMFCDTYIRVGVGNTRGWEVKMIRLRNKFKNQSADTIPPYQEEEFVLWKQMFMRVPPSDAGSRIS